MRIGNNILRYFNVGLKPYDASITQGCTLRCRIAPFQGYKRDIGLKLPNRENRDRPYAIEQNNAVIPFRNPQSAFRLPQSFFFLFLLLPLLSFAQSHNSLIRDGNTNYDKNDYSAAEIKYRKALVAKPISYTAMFNLGDALYQQKRYEDAAKQYENAATMAPDKLSRAKAFHNLGNSYMSQQKWDESINAFKQSLKNNPNDADTKYNLSYALAKKKDQDKKNQNGKGGGQGDKDKDKDKNGQQNKQGDQKKDQQGQGDKDKQAQQQKGAAMTDRDLDAVNEQEKNTQKKVMMELMKKQPKNNDTKTDKPW